MARKINKVNKIKRRSVKSLLNMEIEEFNKLTKDELQVAVEKMRVQSQRRIANLEKHNEYSPAYFSYIKGDRGIYGESLQDLRSEFSYQKRFLSSTTSTLKGYKEYKENIINELKNEGININKKQYDKFFKTYERLAEIDPSVRERGFKYNVLKTLSEYMTNDEYDIDEIIENMTDEIENIYETNQEMDNVDDFFTIDEWEW